MPSEQVKATFIIDKERWRRFQLYAFQNEKTASELLRGFVDSILEIQEFNAELERSRTEK